MFVGGVGVLGNIVFNKGDSVVKYWRGTHDIDVLIRNPHYLYLASNIFEEIDACGKSLSIPNKYTIRGKSKDYEGRELSSMVVDAFTPNEHPNRGIPLGGGLVTSDFWDRITTSSIYGIDVPLMDPLDLLKLKLQVSTSSGSPRKKDCQDIYHLLAVISERGYSPKEISSYLGDLNKKRLIKSVEDIENDKTFLRLVHPRKNFIKCLEDIK
jgi:hypothetical protein